MTLGYRLKKLRSSAKCGANPVVGLSRLNELLKKNLPQTEAA